MRTIFKESRIKFNELLDDAKKYLSDVHNQNSRVYTSASPFGQILTVLVGLAQKIFYFIEDSVTEMNISSASRESSIKGLIALTGYQPKNATSASGNVILRFNGNTFDDELLNQIIIPNYSSVFCLANNLNYLIESNSEIRFSTTEKQKEITVRLVQGEIFEQSFTGIGTPLQSYRINERFFDFVDHDSLKVKLNGILCQRYESIFDIPLNGHGYLVKTSVGGGIDIFFGTAYNGVIPPLGSNIQVSYIKNAGASGNLIDAKELKFEFVEEGYDNQGNQIDLNEYLEIEALNGIVLGSNPEDVEITKIAGPKHSRSFVLSNVDAYESFLSRMNYFSNIEVFNTFEDDNLDDDNVIYMFLIPNLKLRITPNSNYFTSPLNSYLLTEQERNNLLEYIESTGRVMIGTEFEIIQPRIKKFTCHVVIDVFNGYSKELIRTAIINSLSDYFINYTRRDRIPKSDLVAIIESIEGIDSVNVYFKEDPANFSIDSESFINEMGDIQIGKRDYPLIRGGWTDNTGVYYIEDLSENKPSSLNITFNRQVDKTTNRIKNKSIVSALRNNFK